jgi:hypothetical protein
VHLPGSAVDTALLEDGLFFISWYNGILTVCNSDTKRSSTAGNEGEVMGENWIHSQAMGA